MKILAVFLQIALLAINIIWRGFVVSILWAWFVVGQLGMPALGIAQAIGLSIVVSMLTHQSRPGDEWEGRRFEMWSQSFVTPGLLLCVAWIVKRFLPA